VTLLRQGGWTRWPTEVPSNPYYSVILWFCDSAIHSGIKEWHWVYVSAFNVILESEYCPDGSNKVFDRIYCQSECSHPLLNVFFGNCFMLGNAHLCGIIQQLHQGRTRNCTGVSTSPSSWTNEKSFCAECSEQGEKTVQRENMKEVREKQQLSNSSSVYLSILHSYESCIFFFFPADF